MKKKKRIGLNDRTLENDIKYEGFLSYRHLRIIAWICLIIAQIGTVISIAGKLNPPFNQDSQTWQTVCTYFAAIPVPLFLLANFVNILKNRNHYRSLFILYGGGALGLYVLANLIVFHYGHRFINSFGFGFSWGDTARLFGNLLPALGRTGYVFNIFIDLLLCTLLFFFMNYQPKRVFTGKKIIIFRC